MLSFARSISSAALLGAALTMGGCATVEDVKKAQATADQAMSAAQAAQQTANSAQSQAQAAMSAAQAAQQSANQANSGMSDLNSKVQGVQQDVDTLKAKPRRRGQRG
jgi:murein lipoprotein